MVVEGGTSERSTWGHVSVDPDWNVREVKVVTCKVGRVGKSLTPTS